VLIPQVDKVVCCHTDLKVLILKGVEIGGGRRICEQKRSEVLRRADVSVGSNPKTKIPDSILSYYLLIVKIILTEIKFLKARESQEPT
jgi:hypothetical protein